MKLIEDWKKSWKMYSVHLAVAIALLATLQTEILPIWNLAIPEEIYGKVNAVLATLIIIARNLKQKLDEPAEEPAEQDTAVEPDDK